MKTLWKLIAIIVVLAAVGFGIWWYKSPKVEKDTMSDSKIENVKSMVRLSNLELYEEVPVKGTIGKRHLVARLALEGSVDFDLEKLKYEEKGDTVIVVLPPETVTLRESTRRDAYTVLDTWNDNFFGSDNITAAEENKMKAKAIANARNLVYSKGYVKQARADAVNSVKSLLSAILPGKTVIVTDPTPEGRK